MLSSKNRHTAIGFKQLSVLVEDDWVTIDLGNPLHLKLFRETYDKQQALSGRGSGQGNFGKRLSMQVVRRAPQAVVKIVRKGGTTDVRGMRDQMAYLSQNGAVAIERAEFLFGLEVEPKDFEDLADTWNVCGRNRNNSDKTTHFIVSFPQGTDHEAAYKAGRAWAEELFTTEKYGDVFDYYTAFHTDRDHPHMHVVVSRRGLHEQSWLKVSKRSEFNYDRLRMVQVEVAAQHGIALEATPRLARGISERPITDEELRRAAREKREPVRPSHTTESALRAAANIVIYANQFLADARLLAKDHPVLGNTLAKISNQIIAGDEILPDISASSKDRENQFQTAENQIVSTREEMVSNLKQIRKELDELPHGDDRDQLEKAVDEMLENTSRFLPEVWASRDFTPLLSKNSRERKPNERASTSTTELTRGDRGQDLDF